MENYNQNIDVIFQSAKEFEVASKNSQKLSTRAVDFFKYTGVTMISAFGAGMFLGFIPGVAVLGLGTLASIGNSLLPNSVKRAKKATDFEISELEKIDNAKNFDGTPSFSNDESSFLKSAVEICAKAIAKDIEISPEFKANTISKLQTKSKGISI